MEDPAAHAIAMSGTVQREDRGHEAPSLAEELLEIGMRCAALPDLNKCSADKILGYNDFSA